MRIGSHRGARPASSGLRHARAGAGSPPNGPIRWAMTSPTRVVHPIDRAWISTGGTGARNYDEFADDAEITEIIAANPDSALAIEMPHCAPDSSGRSFVEALPDAVRRLERQRADGSYAVAESILGLYRIAEPGRLDEAGYGLFAMVDTDQ